MLVAVVTEVDVVLVVVVASLLSTRHVQHPEAASMSAAEQLRALFPDNGAAFRSESIPRYQSVHE